MKRHNLLIGLAAITGSLTLWAADSLDQWQWRSPLPYHGYVLSRVIYANGSFLAVGEDGVTLSSADGTNWTFNRVTPPDSFSDVVYGRGLYVAVGYRSAPDQARDRPVILTSTDGLSWAAQDIPDPLLILLTTVTYGDGLFVAVGTGTDPFLQSYGAILTSADGLHWSSQHSAVGSLLWGVAYGNGTYVAVGDQGEVLTSPDGVSWSSWVSMNPYGMLLPDHFQGISYINGTFIALTEPGMLISTDGRSWEHQHGFPSVGEAALHVAYGNGRFVATGVGMIGVSTSLTNWSMQSLGAGTIFRGIAFGNGMFVTVAPSTLLGSTNGAQWTRLLGPEIISWFTAVVYGNGLFLAIGEDGTTLRSQDGVQWTQGVCPITPGDDPYPGLTFGQGLFVAVGDRGTIAASPDGVQWSLCRSGVSARLYGATYATGLFVVGGDGGTLLTSGDGTNWTPRTTGVNTTLWDLAYGNGTCLVLCIDGTLLTSTNLADWSNLGNPTSPTNPVQSVAFGNATFVAVTRNAFLHSTNGVDWSAARSGTEQLVTPVRVRFQGGTFVAVGAGGGILSSMDGINWVSHSSGTQRALHGLAYGAGTYVVVGEYGAVLQSGGAPPWSLRLGPVASLANGACAVTIQGEAGHNWELQGSTNFVNWVPLTSLFSTNTSFQFINCDATNYNHRFYRARGW